MTFLNRPNRAVTISLEGRLVKGGNFGSQDWKKKRLDSGANSWIGQSYSTWETDKWSAPLLRCLWQCGGKEPRLRNCRPAAATESYIRDTTASLKTSLAIPPGGPEEEYYWGLGYGGDIIEVSTRDWYLMFNSNSPLSGGQKHTHIEYNVEIKILKVSNECFFRSANVFRL